MNQNWQDNPKVYEVGWVLIEFIVENWGMSAVVELIKNLGNINAVLGVSVTDSERGWHEFIKNRDLFRLSKG